MRRPSSMGSPVQPNVRYLKPSGSSSSGMPVVASATGRSGPYPSSAGAAAPASRRARSASSGVANAAPVVSRNDRRLRDMSLPQRPVHYSSADHRHHRSNLLDLHVGHSEVVPIEHDQIGELAGLDR